MAHKLISFSFQKDQEKLSDYLKRINQVKDEDTAIEFFSQSCTNKLHHWSNQRPIDKIEFIAKFELYQQIAKSLLVQIENKTLSTEDVIKVEKKIVKVLESFDLLLQTGKDKWCYKLIEETVDNLTDYLHSFFINTTNPAVLFNIFKTIPIDCNDLDNRNLIISYFSHFSKDSAIIFSDIKKQFHEVVLEVQQDFQKILTQDQINYLQQLLSQPEEDLFSSFTDFKNKMKEITLKELECEQQHKINLIQCLFNFQKMNKIHEDSVFLDLISCISHISQSISSIHQILDILFNQQFKKQYFLGYSDEKKQYQSKYPSLSLIGSATNPRLLYEELLTFLEKYKDSENIQYFFQLLASIEYEKAFSSDKFVGIYQSSSLFLRLEEFIISIMEDIHSNSTQGTQFSLNASSIILSNISNIKDFFSVALQSIDSLKYFSKIMIHEEEHDSKIQKEQRHKELEYLQKLFKIHKEIILSFVNGDWIYDSINLENYIHQLLLTLPEYHSQEISSQLQVKVVEQLSNYLETGILPQYKNGNKQINEDEFIFVMKSLLKIIEDSLTEDQYEEYLNDIFFNTKDFAKLCLKNTKLQEDNSIRCFLLNTCFKSSAVEQMENYYSWKSEKKVSEFEESVNLFISEGMRIDKYYETFVTCYTGKQVISNQEISDIYARLNVKYYFSRIFDCANKLIETTFSLRQNETSIQEFDNQMNNQIKQISEENEMVYKLLSSMNVTQECNKDYSFLYQKILYWINAKNETLKEQINKLLFELTNVKMSPKHNKNELFTIGYQYNLKVAPYLLHITKSKTFDKKDITESERQILTQFGCEKTFLSIIDEFKSKFESQYLVKLSEYILNFNRKNKENQLIENNDERHYHSKAQQFILLITFLSQSEVLQEYQFQLFQEISQLLPSMLQIICFLKKVNHNDEEDYDSYSKLNSLYSKNYALIEHVRQYLKKLQASIQCSKNIKEMFPEAQEVMKNNIINSLLTIESELLPDDLTPSQIFYSMFKFNLFIEKYLSNCETPTMKYYKEYLLLLSQHLSRDQSVECSEIFFEKVLPLLEKRLSQVIDQLSSSERRTCIKFFKSVKLAITSLLSQFTILSIYLEIQNDKFDSNNLFQKLNKIAHTENLFFCLSLKNSEVGNKISLKSKFFYFSNFLKKSIEKSSGIKWIHDHILDDFSQSLQKAITNSFFSCIKPSQVSHFSPLLLEQNTIRFSIQSLAINVEINDLITLIKEISKEPSEGINQVDLFQILVLSMIDQDINEPQLENDSNEKIELQQEMQQQLDQCLEEKQLKPIEINSSERQLIFLFFAQKVLLNLNKDNLENGLEKKILASILHQGISIEVYSIVLEPELIESLVKYLKSIEPNQMKKSEFNLFFNQAFNLYKKLHAHEEQLKIDIAFNKLSPEEMIENKLKFFSSNLLILSTHLLNDHQSPDNILEFFSRLIELNDSQNNYQTLFDALSNYLFSALSTQFFIDSFIIKLSSALQTLKNLQQNTQGQISENNENTSYKSLNSLNMNNILKQVNNMFQMPNFYASHLKNEQTKNTLAKITTEEILQEELSLAKNRYSQNEESRNYFQRNQLPFKVLEIIFQSQSSISGILMSLFPQTVFIFKDKIIEQVSLILANYDKSNLDDELWFYSIFQIIINEEYLLKEYQSIVLANAKESQSVSKKLSILSLAFPSLKSKQMNLIKKIGSQISLSKNMTECMSNKKLLDKQFKDDKDKKLNNQMISKLQNHIGDLLQDKTKFQLLEKRIKDNEEQLIDAYDYDQILMKSSLQVKNDSQFISQTTRYLLSIAVSQSNEQLSEIQNFSEPFKLIEELKEDFKFIPTPENQNQYSSQNIPQTKQDLLPFEPENELKQQIFEKEEKKEAEEEIKKIDENQKGEEKEEENQSNLQFHKKKQNKEVEQDEEWEDDDENDEEEDGGEEDHDSDDFEDADDEDDQSNSENEGMKDNKDIIQNKKEGENIIVENKDKKCDEQEVPIKDIMIEFQKILQEQKNIEKKFFELENVELKQKKKSNSFPSKKEMEEEEGDDSSDYDHEREKLANKKDQSNEQKLGDDNATTIVVDNNSEKNEINDDHHSEKKIEKEKENIQFAKDSDNEDLSEDASHESKDKNEDMKNNSSDSYEDEENEQTEEDEDEEEDSENEEDIKKEFNQWKEYLLIKERYSTISYLLKNDKEELKIKNEIFTFIKDIKKNQDKKQFLNDILKHLDNKDPIKIFLHTKFPKDPKFKIIKPKTNHKLNKCELSSAEITFQQKQNEESDKEQNKKPSELNQLLSLNKFTDEVEKEESKNQQLDSENKQNNPKSEESDNPEWTENENDESLEQENLNESNYLHISSSEDQEMDEEEQNDDDDYASNRSDDYDDEEEDEGDDDDDDNVNNIEDEEDDDSCNSFKFKIRKNLSEEKQYKILYFNQLFQYLASQKFNESERNFSLTNNSSDQDLVDCYSDNLVFYKEEIIEWIVMEFFSPNFKSENLISNELINPIHGPQVMDALFFFLQNRNLNKISELNLLSLIPFYDKQYYLNSYITFYENAIQFFYDSLIEFNKNGENNTFLSYFTLSASHWEYLPQLSIIKKLKIITNFKQISGLQCLLSLYGDSYKLEEIQNNRRHITLLSKISKFIKSIDLHLSNEKLSSIPNYLNPILNKEDADNILHYYYYENIAFSDKPVLFSFLKKGIKNSATTSLQLLEIQMTQSTLLIRDVISLVGQGIEDVKKILSSNDKKSKEQAISHINEIFSFEESNSVYEGYKSFAANFRESLRLFFAAVKKLDKEKQKVEMINLQKLLGRECFMKLVTKMICQLQFLFENLLGEHSSGSVLDMENNELEQIFTSFIPILKLLYMLYPFFNENKSSKNEEQKAEQQLLQLARIASKQQSSTISEEEEILIPHQSRVIDIALEEGKILELDELKTILESGLCQIIKLFSGMDDQLFQKYIHVVSKDPQKLKSLDLETRMLAIQAKAIKRAEKIENCSEELISINVNRGCVFEDAFRVLIREKPHQLLQKQFTVKFRKEEGIDQSGLTREWYSCFSKELFDPRKGLFRVASKKYVVLPSPSSELVPDHLTIFRFAGAITAKSILEGYLLGIDFPKFFLKHITGTPLHVEDLDDVDPELCKNLVWILENNVDDLYSTFIYEYEEMGERRVKELVPNGSEVLVSQENKKEYVTKLINYIMNQQINQQIQSFLDGFFSIFPQQELFLIDWVELGTKISGAQEIDMKELRLSTSYLGGYSEATLCIQWFWDILLSFDDKMKHKFLFFLSGSYKVPFGKYKDLGFTISKVFNLQNLPVAHTCFNQLDLPPYEDKETLHTKLLQAILEGYEGFGIA